MTRSVWLVLHEPFEPVKWRIDTHGIVHRYQYTGYSRHGKLIYVKTCS